jgi:protein ImuB
MFACLHAPGNLPLLLECARQFSPWVEETSADTVIFEVHGLRALIGSPRQIADAIIQRVGIPARLALAPDPDTATFAARGIPGITVIERGDEARTLAPLPVNLLMAAPEICETLDQWGIRTFGELAQLPPLGLSARLGQEGLRLWQLARGEFTRPLRPLPEAQQFSEMLELEHAVDLLEPLAFLLSRMLHDLCGKLAYHALAIDQMRLVLTLENAPEHARMLRFPVPLQDPKTLLQLWQLDLKDHPPSAPIVAIRLEAEPAKPRIEQHGLFVPQAPEPRRMEITLARITALVGAGNAGTPELVDTHRPGDYRMVRFTPQGRVSVAAAPADPQPAMRRFRPPRAAQVQVRQGRPVRLWAPSLQGQVADCAGPWNTSGDWWKPSVWDHDEWDIALTNGGIYRVFRDRMTGMWFVEGSYD